MNSSGRGAWDADDVGEEDDGLERVGHYPDAAEEPDPGVDRYGSPGSDEGVDSLRDGDDPADDYLADDDPGLSSDEDDEVDESQAWVKEMGFPDQLGVVRVWVDDDALIERVRLSIHWRTRLGEQTLQQSFGVVFMLINNYHRLQQRRTLNYYEPEREAAEPLSFEALDRIRERSDEVRRQLEALGDGGHPQLQGEETIGVALHGRVQLKLNLVGQLDGVQFDPTWLRTARIKEISDAVVEAHADARRRFVPAEVIVGEREKLVNELAGLRNETLAMMRRGFY
ncbi:hypothetical protein ACPCG0_02405 [Propionibacteriaceae bacterium Y1923]|uniref:hypothetical protein n=1 Tax=Aestuariimicrobium sp. Y1814 TaxID=3418742 RepID=UPI003C1F99C1